MSIQRSILGLAIAFAAVAMLPTSYVSSASAAPAVQAAGDVSGTYSWSGGGMGGGGGGNNESTLTLKQDGTKLTGTLSGGRGGDLQIEDGTVDGNKIHFTTTREFNNNKFVTEYSGTVDGDTLKLTIINKREIEAKKKS